MRPQAWTGLGLHVLWERKAHHPGLALAGGAGTGWLSAPTVRDHLLLPNASLASKGVIPISCLAVGRQGTEFPGTLAGGWGGALREGASFQK